MDLLFYVNFIITHESKNGFTLRVYEWDGFQHFVLIHVSGDAKAFQKDVFSCSQYRRSVRQCTRINVTVERKLWLETSGSRDYGIGWSKFLPCYVGHMIQVTKQVASGNERLLVILRCIGLVICSKVLPVIIYFPYNNPSLSPFSNIRMAYFQSLYVFNLVQAIMRQTHVMFCIGITFFDFQNDPVNFSLMAERMTFVQPDISSPKLSIWCLH